VQNGLRHLRGMKDGQSIRFLDVGSKLGEQLIACNTNRTFQISTDAIADGGFDLDGQGIGLGRVAL